jgi:hypothetical protein
LDDVWCWTVLTGLGEVLGWGTLVTGVVFSDETDDKAGPESEADASESSPSLDGEDLSFSILTSFFSAWEGEGLWEEPDDWDDGTGHEGGGEDKLDGQNVLNVLLGDGPDVDEEH